jgi:hypothetical protein
MPIQEKVQYNAPPKAEPSKEWSTLEANRVVRHERAHNQMPVGYSASTPADSFRDGGWAGSTDVTDDVNVPNLRKGFTGHKMGMTDEMYSNEHEYDFYGDAGGFVERGNVLDRL